MTEVFGSIELITFEIDKERTIHMRLLSIWIDKNNSSLFEIYLGESIYIDILYSWFFYSLTEKILNKINYIIKKENK